MTNKELPTALETADDYVNACENFILPLFIKQSKKIVEVIKKIHMEVNEGDLEQERIDFYVNEIKELCSFANKESPMNPYFQNVVKLEQRLEAEGYFNEKEKE